MCSTLSLFPQLPPDLLSYHDTAFRYMAASNTTMAWAKVNKQFYNDILKKRRPSLTALLAMLMAIVPWSALRDQSLLRPLLSHLHHHWPVPHPHQPSTPIQPRLAQPLQQGASCHELRILFILCCLALLPTTPQFLSLVLLALVTLLLIPCLVCSYLSSVTSPQ